MIALQITSMKNFMNKLLVSDAFDPFLLEEATISTANTYNIDGHINKDFYPAEEQNEETIPYDLCTWSSIKGLCFNLIKGKHTPTFFRFVLHLKPEIMNDLLKKGDDTMSISIVKSFVLNIRYDGSKAVLTTATAFNTFSMDKEPDKIWDNHIKAFLTECGLEYEIL